MRLAVEYLSDDAALATRLQEEIVRHLRNIAVTVRLNGVTSVADALRHRARARARAGR